ncbi:hypothetical protein, partial [Nocardia asiatica]|uniref:hypothetical protein n=1 Tax=Nocardia asiatica TaxID=209252 RepID=UPI0024585F3F
PGGGLTIYFGVCFLAALGAPPPPPQPFFFRGGAPPSPPGGGPRQSGRISNESGRCGRATADDARVA